MAREDWYPTREKEQTRPRTRVAREEEPLAEELESERRISLDEEEESPFLRGQKRVPVRRGPLPRKAASRLKWAFAALLVLGLVGLAAAWTYRYGVKSWRFRLESRDNLEVTGAANVPRAQVLELFAGDIGHNVFSLPLEERKKQLEEIPWVESATVMRLLPNRVKVEIRERTPVAFVQIGSKISLIDSNGVIVELPSGKQKKYSFPVTAGMGDAEPLSTRAARMKIYNTLVRELDSEGGSYSAGLSEVDLSDTDDAKVTVADPVGAVLVHLGSGNFLARYKVYLAHVQEWRQQFQKLESVDLRYDRQVIVNPDTHRATPAAEKAVPKPAAPARRAAKSRKRK
ncbi:MAG TPA: FtsQ-type POTRA domain-containing protein [Terriglobales bacterium]|nr:FtsQ-type POTRA domain-containing protein [Terriglobales bacterium]